MLPGNLISKFKSRIRSSLQYSPDSEVDFVSGVDTNPKPYLHSRRRYLINSIPLLSIVALLVGFSISITINLFGPFGWFNGECYATDTATTLQVVTPELSDTIVPNTTSYLSSEVVYSVENVENYALQISYAEGSNSLKAESGNTTIADTVNTQGTLAKNTWGYAWGDTNTDNTTLTYQAMPAYGNAKTIEQGASDVSSTTKKIVFAANLGDDIPTGHYKTNVLLSLVATPKNIGGIEIGFGGVTTMQELTPRLCGRVNDRAMGLLKDERDEKIYWVAKLKDGNCWMTQNLDLDLADSTIVKDLSLWNQEDYQVNQWYEPGEWVFENIYDNKMGYHDITSFQEMSSKGWSSPEELKMPTVDKDAWTATDEISFLSSQSYIGTDGHTACSKEPWSWLGDVASANTACWVYYGGYDVYYKQYMMHYSIGNYYSWQAAVKDSGTVSNDSSVYPNSLASESICPKNWELPLGNTYDTMTLNDSFGGLLGSYGYVFDSNGGTLASGNTNGGTEYDIYKFPFYYVYGGSIEGSKIKNVSTYGRYWSRTAVSRATVAILYFYTSQVGPTITDARYFGLPIRCMVAGV